MLRRSTRCSRQDPPRRCAKGPPGALRVRPSLGRVKRRARRPQLHARPDHKVLAPGVRPGAPPGVRPGAQRICP
eukprot:6344411-Alexandrium_andersonii.AAC.1